MESSVALALGIGGTIGVLQGLDIISTNLAIADGGRETRKFNIYFMKRFGKLWWIPKMLVAACATALIIYVHNVGYPSVAFGGLFATIVYYLKIIKTNFDNARS